MRISLWEDVLRSVVCVIFSKSVIVLFYAAKKWPRMSLDPPYVANICDIQLTKVFIIKKKIIKSQREYFMSFLYKREIEKKNKEMNI